MTKYEQYFQEMVENHQELFKDFKQIHDKYVLEPEKYQKEYNEIGQEVMNVIRKTENMLCGHQEGGKYGKFSSKLSEAFWTRIRRDYPKIDFVGLL